MPSPRLERVKASHRDLSGLLDKLAIYIDRQIASGQDTIIPKLAAASLGIDAGEAFVLLRMMVDGGLLHRVFNVYCSETGMLITTVTSEEGLDNVPHCPFDDKDHEPHELSLEIAFEPVDRSFRLAA